MFVVQTNSRTKSDKFVYATYAAFRIISARRGKALRTDRPMERPTKGPTDRAKFTDDFHTFKTIEWGSLAAP